MLNLNCPGHRHIFYSRHSCPRLRSKGPKSFHHSSKEGQKAIIKAPASSAITLSDNLRDLLGSDTKTFQVASLTTLAYPCDILNGLKYFKINCNEINRDVNLKGEPNEYVIGTNTLDILNIKSFSFIGVTQYHDADEFCVKELIHTAFFNSLNFTLEGNNGQPVGEAFVELLLT